MEIIHYLDSIDKQWLLALNNDYPTFWDNIMWYVSAKNTWIPFYAVLVYVFIRHWKKQSIWIIGGLVLAVVLSDQISSGIIKEVVQRFRPSRSPDIQHLVELVRDYRGGKYGFVSSHAANSFSIALLTSLIIKNRYYTITAFFWAILVSYSRIYLGVHYPGDILGGMIVGMCCALFVNWLLHKYRPQLFDYSVQTLQFSRLPIWILLSSLAVIVAVSAFVI